MTDVALNDEAFVELFNKAVFFSGKNDSEVADELRVSRLTVECWSNGKNLPHGTVRRIIIDAMSDMLKR